MKVRKDMEFKFVYDDESDVLSIFNYKLKSSESIEFSENIIFDINKDDCIVGLQILDASGFFSNLNENIDKEFLNKLEKIDLIDKEYRNNWFIMLLIKSKGFDVIQQPMPLLRKQEYKSPLLCVGK